MGPAMADEEKYKVALFDGNDFSNWKFRIEVLLEEHDLLQYIEISLEEIIGNKIGEEKKKHEQEEKKCKSLIVRRIADSHLEYIKDKKRVKEIIDTLKATFERKSMASQLYLRKKLLTMKCSEDEDITKHLLLFYKTLRELKSTGATVEEADKICHLLLTLPNSFQPLITALETLEPNKLTMDIVKSRLFDEVNKRKHGIADVGLQGKVALNASNFKFKCYNCGEVGHKRSDCKMQDMFMQRNLNYKKYANFTDDEGLKLGADDVQEEIVFIAQDNLVLEEKSNCIEWIVDSGVSDHMVNNEHYFEEVSLLKDPIKVAVAKNGVTLLATKIGKIKGYLIINNKKISCVVENVLYVPCLKCNLLSVRKLGDLGMAIIFNEGFVKIYKGNKTVGIGNLKGKLYQINLFVNIKESYEKYAGISERSDDLEIWHRRLGHLNIQDVLKLINNEMVSGVPEIIKTNWTLCEPCLHGKQSRQPFHAVSDCRSSRPLQLIQSDVCGPISPMSWNHKKYFVTFLDDFTHFTMVYMLSCKSEVFKCFMEYQALATAHFGNKISRLKCDNGGEYVSNEFKSYCTKLGIQIEYTVPYTPEQNGVAERLNRTLIEKARTMIMESGLSKSFWNEAVFTATYLLNRSPTRSLKVLNSHVTPAEMWYGKKPNISNLKMFGCIAYSHIHIPKQCRNKMDSKTSKNIMIGYASNGYRLWNVETRRIIIARDVIFDENCIVEKLNSIKKVKETIFEIEEGIKQSEYNKNPAIEELEDSNLNYQEVVEEDIPEEVEVVEEDIPEEVEVVEDIPEVEVVEEDIPEEVQDRVNNFETESDTEIPEQQLGRNERVKKPPKWHEDYDMSYMSFALNAESFIGNLPTIIEELKLRDDWSKWKEAVQKEIDSLNKNKAWNLIILPEGREAIGCKWIFEIKQNADGETERYKARLIAKGCSQQKGFDYMEMFAPVAKLP